jgi:hypothetical protein
LLKETVSPISCLWVGHRESYYIYRKIPITLFLDDYRWEKTDMVKKLQAAAK